MDRHSKNPAIKLDNIAFKDKRLSFTITDFLSKNVGDKRVGKLKVRIRVQNHLGANISIPFNQLKQGEYQFFIDVTDLLTNKNTSRLNILRI